MNLGLILIVFCVFLFLVAVMAIGVIMGRRPISGSCGGIGRLNRKEGECGICGSIPGKCVEAIAQKSVVSNSVRNSVRSRTRPAP